MRVQRKVWNQFLVLTLILLSPLVITFPLMLHLDQPWIRIRDEGFLNASDVQSFLSSIQTVLNNFHNHIFVFQEAILNPRFSPSFTYLSLATLLSFFSSPLVAHNLMLFLSVILAGLCMYKFARCFSKNTIGCLYAAFMYSSSAFLIHHMLHGHGNQIQIFWIPLIFLLTENIFKYGPSFKRSVSLGLALGLLLLSNEHFSIFMMVMLPLYILARDYRVVFRKRYVVSLITGLSAAFLVSFPLLIKTGRFSVRNSYSISDNLNFSMKMKDVLNPNAEGYLGSTMLILIVIALLSNFLSKKETPQAIYAMSIVFVFSILCALGPFAPWAPYTLFMKSALIFQHMRTPGRMIIFAVCMGNVLSAFAIDRLSGIFSRKLFAIFMVVLLAVTFYSHYLVSVYYLG